jgi:peptidoglycan hydrolase CwlO-like protein
MDKKNTYFWNVPRRVLTHSKAKKDYAFGDEVPVGILDEKTLEALLNAGKLVTTKMVTASVADDSAELRTRLAKLTNENKELAEANFTLADDKAGLENSNKELAEANSALAGSNKELAEAIEARTKENHHKGGKKK